MSTESQRFMFVLRGGVSAKSLSPTEYGEIIQKYLAWIDSLRQRGCYEGGEPLEEEGKVLAGPGGGIVTDGPYAESKEAVGGYFIIKAASLDAAAGIAAGCPIFENGGTVEVRQIAAVPGRERATSAT
jgi:hypothetical protein